VQTASLDTEEEEEVNGFSGEAYGEEKFAEVEKSERFFQKMGMKRLNLFSNSLEKFSNLLDSIEDQIADQRLEQFSNWQDTETAVVLEKIDTEAERLEDTPQSEEEIVERETRRAEIEETVEKLIENSEKLAELKAKLTEHYKKADETAKEKFDFLKKAVEQVMVRNQAFVVHVFVTYEDGRHNSNSNISGRATVEDDLNTILAFEPSIPTSTVSLGSGHRLWTESDMGVILGGGDIQGAAPGDDNTQAKLKYRNGVESSAEEIDEMISGRDITDSYNELTVNNPKVFGVFRIAQKNEAGELYIDENDLGGDGKKLAESRGLPFLIMSPDRRLFNLVDVDERGIVTLGEEVTPEQVAEGKAGMVENSWRQQLGKKILDKHLFRRSSDYLEAKKILAEMPGTLKFEEGFTREEILEGVRLSGTIDWDLLSKDDFADREFLLEIVKNLKDKDIGLKFPLFAEELKNDTSFIKGLYEIGAYGLQKFLPEALKDNQEVVISQVKWSDDIKWINKKWLEVPEVYEEILEQKVGYHALSLEEFRNSDEEEYYLRIKLKLETESGDLEDFSEKLASDEQFLQKLQEANPDFVFSYDEKNFVLVEKVIKPKDDQEREWLQTKWGNESGELDSEILDTPEAYEDFLESKAREMNRYLQGEFRLSSREKKYLGTELLLKTEEGDLEDFSSRLISDERFLQKLQEVNPDFIFSYDERGFLLAEKTIKPEDDIKRAILQVGQGDVVSDGVGELNKKWLESPEVYEKILERQVEEINQYLQRWFRGGNLKEEKWELFGGPKNGDGVYEDFSEKLASDERFLQGLQETNPDLLFEHIGDGVILIEKIPPIPKVT